MIENPSYIFFYAFMNNFYIEFPQFTSIAFFIIYEKLNLNPIFVLLKFWNPSFKLFIWKVKQKWTMKSFNMKMALSIFPLIPISIFRYYFYCSYYLLFVICCSFQLSFRNLEQKKEKKMYVKIGRKWINKSIPWHKVLAIIYDSRNNNNIT